MTKLIIFDLDGTLLNTIEDITYSLNLALEENGLAPVTIDECKYMVGSGANILIERAIKGNNEAFDRVLQAYLTYYLKHQEDKTRPYEGIVEVLHDLKRRGYRLAILSNKPHVDTINVVESYFGLDLFDIVMGKKEHNRIKPSIDGCIEIMDTLGIHDNILYVGDTAVDMQTARNAGYTSVAVTWGFRNLKNYKTLII